MDLDLVLIQQKWDEILDYIRIDNQLTDVSFNTWLKPLKVHGINGKSIIIVGHNDAAALNYISQKYTLFLKVAISEITGIMPDFELEFVPEKDIKPIKSQTASKADNLNNTKERSNLNPKYTFDTFIVGGNNSFAHAASLAVAESPGEVYNPLFLYGGVGLGKTHLMHSVAHFILDKNPDAKVLYVTSELFTNELIDAIRNGNNTAMSKFREKYRNIDVLLIDDIQFIIGKESTQEEFFHTFNDLHGSKKQIILSSDKPPKDMETLENRLRSRFEWGLIADISSPDYETRMAILKKKQELDGIFIDDKVIEYIATNVKSNIRELEGAFNKVVAYSNLEKREINLELAEKALLDIISPDVQKEITCEFIIDVVAEHFQIPASDLSSSKRNKEIVKPRQIAMYLCREMTDTPLKTIGEYFGKKDHTTVIHGVDKIAKEIATNEATKNTIETITKKINPN